MKKTTRCLAVLAAMATLTIAASPAYAADESSTPTVAEETSKITQDVYSQINAGDKTVKVLSDTVEQLVSKDGTFSNNELIYSDKYKFAVESLPADPERGLPDRDVLVVYDIPYEDTTGMSDGEWKKHISINYYDYSYVDELWLPGGPDRLIYSGCRYRFVTSKNKSFKLENELEIVFVVNGERPKTDYDNTEEQINAIWGFDIFKYVNFNQDAAYTDTKENTDLENTEKEASAIKTAAALKGDADVNNEAKLSDEAASAQSDPNNDPDHIAELIIGFIKENDMDCNVTVEEKNVTVWLGAYLGKQHYNNETLYKRRTEDSNAIEAFISDNNIDQSMVMIVWPDVNIIDEDPITNKPLLRIKGDADLNGKVDLADLTTVAKYNLNNELYPLANEIAFANADMNSDGEVNGVDTSALIENQLGKK